MKKEGLINIQNGARTALEKIVVNAGVGRLSSQPQFEEKILPQIMQDLMSISGQKPEVRKAKRSIAGFKVREGQVVGLRVTLRRARMIDFFTKLITIVLPRVRDFHGISPQSIDQKGILNIGIREHLVFPEVNQEISPFSFSLGMNIVPKKKDRTKAEGSYRTLGVPFMKETPRKR